MLRYVSVLPCLQYCESLPFNYFLQLWVPQSNNIMCGRGGKKGRKVFQHFWIQLFISLNAFLVLVSQAWTKSKLMKKGSYLLFMCLGPLESLWKAYLWSLQASPKPENWTHWDLSSTWPFCGYISGPHTRIESRFALSQSISGQPRVQSFHMMNGLINLQDRERKEK